MGLQDPWKPRGPDFCPGRAMGNGRPRGKWEKRVVEGAAQLDSELSVSEPRNAQSDPPHTHTHKTRVLVPGHRSTRDSLNPITSYRLVFIFLRHDLRTQASDQKGVEEMH